MFVDLPVMNTRTFSGYIFSPVVPLRNYCTSTWRKLL